MQLFNRQVAVSPSPVVLKRRLSRGCIRADSVGGSFHDATSSRYSDLEISLLSLCGTPRSLVCCKRDMNQPTQELSSEAA